MAVDINITSITTQSISAGEIKVNGEDLLKKSDLHAWQFPTYTINGVEPDDNGNFEITVDTISAAPTLHSHGISELTGLSEAFAAKANVNHDHPYVKTLTVNDTSLSGAITLAAGSGVNIVRTGNTVTLNAAPYDFSNASSIADSSSSTKQLKVFVGTQTEWNSMTKDNSYKYIVFIKD